MAEKTKEIIAEETYVLTLQDRCDSCHAQALVWVNGVNGELLFCGHHFNKFEKKLREYAYEIIDERSKLVENKLIGSEN